jgi:hypothetical protein
MQTSAPEAANMGMTQNKVYGVPDTALVVGVCGDDIIKMARFMGCH